MSFLLNNDSEYIAARITNYGRQKVAEGNFNIEYFQVGDSEFDYNFDTFDGSSDDRPPQKVFAPLDKDAIVKYPYKLSESVTTGTTFGIPVRNSETVDVKNNIGPAGFVSEYVEYDGTTGTTVVCDSVEIDYGQTVPIQRGVNGSKKLIYPNAYTDTDFSSCEYITIAFTRLVGSNAMISGHSNSLVYKVIDFTSGSTENIITLDRPMPDLSNLPKSIATVICNKCHPYYPDGYDLSYNCEPLQQDPLSQQEPWTLNIVWGKKTAGSNVPESSDESLTGYTSNVFVSTKQYLGYTDSDGQLWNTGTTYNNSFNEEIIVPPEDQHSVAIIHYSEQNNSFEPERYYKYEDYLAHQDQEDIDYFEVYIPFLYYHRNTGTTIGARFFMDTTDYYVNSAAIDTKLYKLKYRNLVDENGIKVGKVFVGKKIIVFDDQEIVASLDYKSNRKYTLPVPRVTQVGTDYNYNANDYSLMDGTTGQTLYVSYLFQYTLDDQINGLHCNQYAKVTGTTLPSDVSIKFSENEFKFMNNIFSGYTNGFIANRFKVIAQLVEEGAELEPDAWKIMDFTHKLVPLGHIYGNLINPVFLRGNRFVITHDDYDTAPFYNIDDFIKELPTISDDPTKPQFGDEQPFPGSIKVTRATDFQVLNFLVNLPEGEFNTTQNPTWTTGKDKRITEVALLDDKKEVLVIGKCPYPIKRIGTQVFAVKLDF